jgi:hypothetical protein
MKNGHQGHKQMANADEEKIVVIQKTTRIPGQHKYREGDHDSEGLHQAVEK